MPIEGFHINTVGIQFLIITEQYGTPFEGMKITSWKAVLCRWYLWYPTIIGSHFSFPHIKLAAFFDEHQTFLLHGSSLNMALIWETETYPVRRHFLDLLSCTMRQQSHFSTFDSIRFDSHTTGKSPNGYLGTVQLVFNGLVVVSCVIIRNNLGYCCTTIFLEIRKCALTELDECGKLCRLLICF